MINCDQLLSNLAVGIQVLRPYAWAYSTHHVACLVGYGASGVNPWLGLETCRSWRMSKKVGLLQCSSGPPA